eukprot:TRINITY_DN34287_c0_g1_i1.p1 TRINITY_DN34287_c0_g1~~TRINITY_DN34287_c0_g1_i1.p1  ORF type:complete len:492 (-),score=124.86 TRINITY_DN34287_c0_g1_i1:339-1814(-)
MPRKLFTQQHETRSRRAAAVAAVDSKLKDEHKDKSFAQWEAKTQSKIETTARLAEMDRMQAAHLQNLELRRQRLAELFIAEQESWDRQLASLQETQEQRSERLSAAAYALRSQREARRQEEVGALRRRIFQENCDELRAARAELRAVAVAHERGVQRRWAAERRKMDEATNAWHARQWAEDAQRRAKDDDVETQKRADRDRALRSMLQQQMSEQGAHRQREAEEAAKVDAAAAEYNARLRKAAMEREEQRAKETAAMHAANREANAALEQRRQAERDKARQEEAELVQRLRQEAEEEERERAAEREAAKAKLRKQREMLRAQTSATAESEAELEKLWQEEAAKAWARREEQWAQRKRDRDALLVRVFEERALQVEMKRELESRTKAEAAAEADRVRQEQRDWEIMAAARAANQQDMLHEHGQRLAEQIEFRKVNADRGADALRLEAVAADLAERDYRTAVERELADIDAQRPAGFESVAGRSRRQRSGVNW